MKPIICFVHFHIIVSLSDVASWREGGSNLNKATGSGTGVGAAGPGGEGEGGQQKDKGPMMHPMGTGHLPPNINGAQAGPLPPGPIPPQFRGMMPPFVSVNFVL